MFFAVNLEIFRR